MTAKKDDSGSVSIPVSGKTLGIVLAFIVGLGGAGGGFAALGGGIGAEVMAEVKGLKRTIESLSLAMVDLRGDLKVDRSTVTRTVEDVADHEKRIRRLEEAGKR